LIEAEALHGEQDVVIVDCRFDLADPDAGRAQYLAGHIPGARYLDLCRDLSGAVGGQGGRHPLPDAAVFADALAARGIGPDVAVVAYDDSRLAYAARFWWLMRSLGFRPPRLLNGGYGAWVAAGGVPEVGESAAIPVAAPGPFRFQNFCDHEGLRTAQGAGATVVDSREARRYQGLEEPIDPVAGHIPGAVNRPWQGVTREDGYVRDDRGLRAHWGELLDADALVVYCGSGVTACVNLFSLALLGREDATLYPGSWSDWCSRL